MQVWHNFNLFNALWLSILKRFYFATRRAVYIFLSLFLVPSTYLPLPSIRTLLSVSPTRVCLVQPVTSSIFLSLVPLFSFRDYPWAQGLSNWLRSLSWQYLVWFVSDLCAGMKQLIGKLNDLWPEHSVALSIPKEVDRSKEKLEGAWETTGV